MSGQTVTRSLEWRPSSRWLGPLLTGACVLLSTAPADAIPLPYTAPWNVSFGRVLGNDPDTLAAFGATAGAVHGQIGIGDQLSQIFFARAQAFASAGVFGSDFASATVQFDRPFVLPAGGPYRLVLTARARGRPTISNAVADTATMLSTVCIGPPGGAAFLCVNSADNALFSVTAPPSASGVVTDTLAVTDATAGFVVAPGAYEVRGLLSVSAGTNSGSLSEPDAASQYFFLSPAGFEGFGSYEAQAVPEPGTLLALIPALAALWRRRTPAGTAVPSEGAVLSSR